jgi:hypothetical protein
MWIPDDAAHIERAATAGELRRTFASILYVIGEPPPVVMQEMGHTDPELALRVYAEAMRPGEDEKERLRVLAGEGASGERYRDREGGVMVDGVKCSCYWPQPASFNERTGKPVCLCGGEFEVPVEWNGRLYGEPIPRPQRRPEHVAVLRHIDQLKPTLRRIR